MGWLREHWQAFLQWPYFWDAITAACLVVAVGGFLWGMVLLLGLPGRIAVARNHPDAEAVYTMGWVGFLAIVPWIQALIWAFKPTDKVDIRYFPQAERISERESLERGISTGEQELQRDQPRRRREHTGQKVFPSGVSSLTTL